VNPAKSEKGVIAYADYSGVRGIFMPSPHRSTPVAPLRMQAALHAILDRWPTSGPADYERRDQRSTKTPRRIRRQSPAHSVGSISAHEALVVEPPRAFFRAANRRPGVKWAIGPIAANGVRWGWLKLEEAQRSTLDDSRRRERKQRVVNGLVKCGASFGFEKHLHQRPKIPIVIVAHP
jgi:hypothetical protein